MTLRIAVLTGSRAEYGILKPLLKLIDENKEIELRLIVTGLHLLEEYGHTIDLIESDDFTIDSTVEMYQDTKNELYYGLALARGIEGLTLELASIKPDILVVLGDRLEPLAATLAAATLKIPIAHIHGGDKTDSGHIDESIRHAITRFAHVHFPATQEHKDRLVNMGEESWRIHKVGSMGLDTILMRETCSKDNLSKRIDFTIDEKTLLVVYHPVHLEDDVGDQMCEIVEAIKELRLQTVLLYPNNDPGNEDIIQEIEKLENFEFVKILKSLPHDDYIDLLKNVAVMIGNSSSGIIEAATVKLPVVNVGSRNRGRSSAKNILYVEPETKIIITAIEQALNDTDYLNEIQNVENPFGDGKTAPRIFDILLNLKIDHDLLSKKITF
ncbi:MAG: UDP-N-acetylglucosamine 2-epimerase [Candidatus Thorarchaeota archaeon]